MPLACVIEIERSIANIRAGLMIDARNAIRAVVLSATEIGISFQKRRALSCKWMSLKYCWLRVIKAFGCHPENVRRVLVGQEAESCASITGLRALCRPASFSSRCEKKAAIPYFAVASIVLPQSHFHAGTADDSYFIHFILYLYFIPIFYTFIL